MEEETERIDLVHPIETKKFLKKYFDGHDEFRRIEDGILIKKKERKNLTLYWTWKKGHTLYQRMKGKEL